MSHYNNSHPTKCQPRKAPVSRIPTGDSSQKTCFKVSSRMNKLGFFQANSNSALLNITIIISKEIKFC